MTERNLTRNESHEWALLCVDYWSTVKGAENLTMADMVRDNEKLWELFTEALALRWQVPPKQAN